VILPGDRDRANRIAANSQKLSEKIRTVYLALAQQALQHRAFRQ
jgi:uridine phosphorylase